MSDEECRAIADKANRIAAIGPPAAVIVDNERPVGEPLWVSDAELRLNPADYGDLLRWADKQAMWMFKPVS